MKKGICIDCRKLKLLNKHSDKGFPNPFVYICRKCHNQRHHIKEHPKKNRKYQRGTKKCHKKK